MKAIPMRKVVGALRLALKRVLLAAWLGLALAGCGRSPKLPPLLPAIDATEAAARAVRQGLVGAAFGQISASQLDIGVAGQRRLGGTEALNGQESFIIGSNTKSMTAMVAARLIERGVLRWDTKIGEALPELQQSMRPDYHAVTLEQLLAHRGGMLAMTEDADSQRFQDYRDNYTGVMPQTLRERRRFFAHWLLMQPPPNGVTPGQDYLYSNAGYALVGVMLEAVTGKSYELLFDEELTQPLGVAGSWLRPELMAADQPVGHEGAPGQVAVVPAPPAGDQQWYDVIAPAGLFSTTPAAYSTWLRWHLLALQGRSTPLPAGYIQRIKRLATGDYAVGWLAGTDSKGRPVLLHAGHWLGFMSIAVVDLAGQCARFGLTNTGEIAPDGSSWVLETLAAQLNEMDRRL